jgi:hypothetical protein
VCAFCARPLHCKLQATTRRLNNDRPDQVRVQSNQWHEKQCVLVSSVAWHACGTSTEPSFQSRTLLLCAVLRCAALTTTAPTLLHRRHLSSSTRVVSVTTSDERLAPSRATCPLKAAARMFPRHKQQNNTYQSHNTATFSKPGSCASMTQGGTSAATPQTLAELRLSHAQAYPRNPTVSNPLRSTIQ